MFKQLLRVAVVGLAVSAALVDIKEAASGILFKGAIKLPGASSENQLLGTGIRVKKIGPVKVNVYAVGIYADAGKATSELSKYSSAADLSKNAGFYQDSITSPFEKTLVLKMARKVGTETMVEALTDAVKPRMGGAGQQQLADFQSMLLSAVSKQGAAVKGMQFGFVCKPGNVCVSIDGKEAGSIASDQLRNSLLDVYLGSDSVSPPAKQSFAAGIAALFKPTAAA